MTALVLAAAGWGLKWLLAQQIYAGASRVRADLRSLATAIESYRADHAAPPPMMPFDLYVDPATWRRRGDGQGLCTVDPGSASRIGLTTPTAYITSLCADPFSFMSATGGRGAITQVPYAYFADGTDFILFSAGLNRRYEITREVLERTSLSSPGTALINTMYDPTNGYHSVGDIVLIAASRGMSLPGSSRPSP